VYRKVLFDCFAVSCIRSYTCWHGAMTQTFALTMTLAPKLPRTFDFIVIDEMNFHPSTSFPCPTYIILPLYLADISLSFPFTPRPFTSTYISPSRCKENKRTIIGSKICGRYGRSTSRNLRYLSSYCTRRVRRCGLFVYHCASAKPNKIWNYASAMLSH
jgi:hypothetical protein